MICLRVGLLGRDEVLLDPHQASPEHTTTYRLLEISRDGQLVVYGVRVGGEDEIAVRFVDVETRQVLPLQMPRARYFGMSLTPDKQTLS